MEARTAIDRRRVGRLSRSDSNGRFRFKIFTDSTGAQSKFRTGPEKIYAFVTKLEKLAAGSRESSQGQALIEAVLGPSIDDIDAKWKECGVKPPQLWSK